jgi:hypothetical protein
LALNSLQPGLLTNVQAQQFAAGLSTGSLNPQFSDNPVFTLADLSGAGPSPSEVMSDVSSQTIGRLQFPQEVPLYFMQFDLANYTRASWLTVGKLDTVATIILPIPLQLIDQVTVEFQKQALNIFGMGWETFAKLNAVNSAGDQNAVTQINGLIQSAANTVQQNAGGGLARGVVSGAENVAPGAGQTLLAAAGVAINNFLTVMLKGPTYKTHRFGWRFSPRNKKESQALSDIITTFKDASAPSLGGTLFGQGAGTSAFFQYPMICTPSFGYNGVAGYDPGYYLYRFRPCFIESIAINFTPAGVPAFYGKTGAIEGMEMAIYLEEIEYWLAGDYKKRRDAGFSPNIDQAKVNNIL